MNRPNDLQGALLCTETPVTYDEARLIWNEGFEQLRGYSH